MKRVKSFVSLLGISVYSYCVIHAVWNYVVQYAVLLGRSMAPTLNDGDERDIVLAEHYSRLTKKLKCNDVVLVKDPSNLQRCLCKRIIAMEKDKMPSNQLKVPTYHKMDSHTIPKGHVWLEGDNSEDSYDSRYFGPIPYALIQSRVFYRIWPLSKFGPVK